MKKTGIDISQKRLDDLDKQAILFSLKNKIVKPTRNFADFGCGSGKVSVVLGTFGYKGNLYDVKKYKKHFKILNSKLNINLDFKKTKIQNISYSDFPKRLDIVISQRTLHYLNYKEVDRFLKQVTKNLNHGGRIFFSLSGLDSELGFDYQEEKDIRKRFFKLSKINKKKFKITEPVCLYTKKDVETLMSNYKLKKIKVWQSDFGNIKAIYEK